MTNDQKKQQAVDLFKNFNRLEEPVKDKILNMVKSLAFLDELLDIKDDTCKSFDTAKPAV